MPVAAFACAYVCACTSFLLLLLLVNGELVGLPKTSLWQSHLYGKGNSDLKGAIRSQNQNHFRKRQQKLGKSAGI